VIRPRVVTTSTLGRFDVKGALKDKNGLMNLPYVVDDDMVVTQSNACMMYLGRKFNLVGGNDKELAAVEMILCEVMDIRNKTTGMAYGDGDLEQHLKVVPGSFAKIELFISQRGTKFSAADTITVADFHLFEMWDQHQLMAAKAGQADFLADCPKIKELCAAIKAEPKLAGYFAGSQYLLPQNNKMAKYGGDLNDGR